MGELCGNCFYEKPTAGVCPACGYDPAKDEGKYPLALRPGSILNGRYIVGRVLGQGGFGITYIAQNYQTKNRVAIKEYLPTDFAGRTQGTYIVQVYSGDRQENFIYGKEQFLDEAKTLAEFIGNDHIVRIYSYFEEYGTAYLTMEYIDGVNLSKKMHEHGGRLTVEQADELLIPVMEALEWVHSRGIVHRDIAPDNIMITSDGKAKLIDFGAARYSTGEKSKSLDVILKHGFAPKEQYIRRGRQGPFTDVYAMAATYYYAITGKIPQDAIERMDEDELIPPSTLGVKIDGKSEDALLKALEVSATDRFQSMGEFVNALNASKPQKEKGPTKQSELYEQKEIFFEQPQPEGKEPLKKAQTEPEEIGCPGKKSLNFHNLIKKYAVWAIAGIATTLLIAAVCIFTGPRNKPLKPETILTEQESAQTEQMAEKEEILTERMELEDGGYKIIEYSSDRKPVLAQAYFSGGTLKEKIQYDSAGNELGGTEYNANGTINNSYEIEYNSSGKEIKFTEFNSDGEIKYRIETQYDDNGDRSRLTRYFSNGDIYYIFEYNGELHTRKTEYYPGGIVEHIYEYDSRGNCVKKTYYMPDGTVDYWIESEFDSGCKEEKRTRYHSYGSVKYWLEFENDSSGNIVKATCFNPNGMVSYIEEYELDSQGRTIRETRYDAGGILKYWVEKEYNEKGYVSLWTRFNPNGTVDYRNEYIYDRKNTAVKTVKYDSSGNIIEIKQNQDA